MSDTENLNVTLSSELIAGIRKLMDDGDASLDAVVQDALWQWAFYRRLQTSAEFREEIGRLWDEGIASGPARDGEEVFKRLRERLKAEVGAHMAK